MTASARTVEIRFLGSTAQLEAALARAGVAAELAGKAIGDKMEGAAARTGGIFQRLGQTMANWGLPFSTSVSKMGEKFNEVEGKGKTFGAALQEVGKAATLGVAAGLAVVAVEGIKAAGSFDVLTERLVTTAGESQSKLAMVRSGILGISVATDTSVTDLAKAMYLVESAGHHGADGLNVLKAAAEGAKSEGANVTTVADALTSALNAYGESGKQAIPVTNELLAAVSVGKMNFQDFAASLSNVLPVAAAAHLSLAQVGGAVATMTAQGMSAQQATQDLANTIRALQAPNSVAVAEMEQLGLSSNDVAEKLGQRGLTGTLQLLTQTIASHMGPSGEVILNAFNQSKSASQDLQIMLQSMPPNVRRLADEFMSGAMTASQFRKSLPTNEQGVIGQFTALYAKANGFNQLLKSGSPAAQTYTAALEKMTGGATGLNTALLLTGGHAATFQSNVDTVANAAHHAGRNIDNWKYIQHEFDFELGQAQKAGEAIAITIGEKLIPVVQAVLGFFEQHTGVLKAVAILFGTVLTVAIGAYVISLGAALAATIAEAAASVSAAAATVAAWAVAAAPFLAIAAAVALLGVAIYELVKHWHTVWGAIKEGAEAVWHFLDGIWHAIEDGVRAAWDWVKNHLGIIIPIIAGIITGPFGAVAALIATHWNTVKNDAAKIWGDIVSFFESIPGKIAQALLSLVDKVGQVASDAWHAFVDADTRLVGDVLTFFEQLPGRILNAVSSLVSDIASFVGQVWQAFVNVDTQLVSDVLNFFAQLPGRIINAVSSLIDDIASFVGQVWGAFVDADTRLVSDVLNFFAQLPGRIINAVSSLIGDIASFVGQMWSGFTSALGTGVTAVMNFFTGLPGKIIGWLGDAGNMLYQVGKDIIGGLAKGITDAVGGLVSGVQHVASSIVHGVTSFFGIGSPSRVMAEVGGFLMEGLAQGITGKSALAAAAMARAARSLEAPIGLSFGTTLATAPPPLTSMARVPPVAGTQGSGLVYQPVYNVPVTGDMSPQTAQRLKQLLDQHDQELLTMLRQVGVAT